VVTSMQIFNRFRLWSATNLTIAIL